MVEFVTKKEIKTCSDFDLVGFNIFTNEDIVNPKTTEKQKEKLRTQRKWIEEERRKRGFTEKQKEKLRIQKEWIEEERRRRGI